MATGRRITVHEAHVKTAAIEVKALVLNNRQITLSVFRQLKKEAVIDADTAQLRGVPWGTVNYFWGKCVDDHLHVVWQCGDELRRDCVHAAAPRELGAGLERRLEDLGTIYVTWLTAQGEEGYRGQGPRERREIRHDQRLGRRVQLFSYKMPAVDLGRRTVGVHLAPDVEALWRGEVQEEGQSIPLSAEMLEGFAHEAWCVAADYGRAWGGQEHVLAAMVDLDAEIAGLRAAWKRQYDALAALDQLFIAV